MAKKAVATLHEGNMDGRAYTKVIKMVKSPKTGAYVFDEKWYQTRLLRISSRINFLADDASLNLDYIKIQI